MISYRLFFLLFLFSTTGFVFLKHCIYEGNSPNRVALCLALLENGSLRIDKYHHFSSDLCIHDGHYYCDKAPGTSFLSMPFIAAAFYGLRALGQTDFTSYDPEEVQKEPNVHFKLLIVVGSLIVSLLCGLAIAVYYAFGVWIGLSQRTAFFGALLLGFGTLFGVWATYLIGHSLAGAFFIFACAAACYLIHQEGRRQCDVPETGDESRSNRVRPATWSWAGVGFLLAYAVWIEYTAAVPAVVLGLLIPCRLFRESGRAKTAARMIPWLFLGALPVAIGFLIYNVLAFGAPLDVGYKYVAANFPKMDEGFYGIRLPDFQVLLKTIFSPEYGLLWFSPIFFFSPFLALRGIFLNRYRAWNIACLLIPAYYFLLNSSYAYWMQSDVAARHTTASFPFLVLPILLSWNDVGPLFRRILALFALAGFFFCFAAVNVPCGPGYYETEFRSVYLVMEFFRGGMRNLLYYGGVSAWLSLIPELLAIALFAFLADRELRRLDVVPVVPSTFFSSTPHPR